MCCDYKITIAFITLNVLSESNYVSLVINGKSVHLLVENIIYQARLMRLGLERNVVVLRQSPVFSPESQKFHLLKSVEKKSKT